MATITGKDKHGNVETLEGVDLSKVLTIEHIDKDLKWSLVTIDDQGTTTTIPFIGGGPVYSPPKPPAGG